MLPQRRWASKKPFGARYYVQAVECRPAGYDVWRPCDGDAEAKCNSRYISRGRPNFSSALRAESGLVADGSRRWFLAAAEGGRARVGVKVTFRAAPRVTRFLTLRNSAAAVSNT